MSITIPSVSITALAESLLAEQDFIDGIVDDVGLNISSNLFSITPPPLPGDPISIDLTVTGTGGVTVDNPLPGFLNIDGTDVIATIDDGFGSDVRGNGSIASPNRVDTLLSSNSLAIIPTILDDTPVGLNLTITGTGGIVTTNPSPGVWNIDGTNVTATPALVDGNGTTVTGDGSLATPFRTNINLITNPANSIFLNPNPGTTGSYGIGFSLTSAFPSKATIIGPTVGTPGQWQINDNLNYQIVAPVSHSITLSGGGSTTLDITIGFMKIGKMATAILSRATSTSLPAGPNILIGSTIAATPLPAPSADWFPDPAFSTPELKTLQGKLQNLDLTSSIVMIAGLQFSGGSNYSVQYEPQHSGPWIKDVAATSWIAPAFIFQWICTV